MWWFCHRRQVNPCRGNNIDAGREIIEASSVAEARRKMRSIQDGLRDNGATMWLKLTQGIFGPFTTKERAKVVKKDHYTENPKRSWSAFFNKKDHEEYAKLVT